MVSEASKPISAVGTKSIVAPQKVAPTDLTTTEKQR